MDDHVESSLFQTNSNDLYLMSKPRLLTEKVRLQIALITVKDILDFHEYQGNNVKYDFQVRYTQIHMNPINYFKCLIKFIATGNNIFC